MKYLVLLSSIALIGCGPSADEIEEMQKISKDNAERNFARFVAETGTGFQKKTVQSDSTIGPDCAYGDGWATIKIELPSGVEGPTEFKCQTNGSGKGISGCLDVVTFNQKDYSSQNGQCDTSLSKLKPLK